MSEHQRGAVSSERDPVEIRERASTVDPAATWALLGVSLLFAFAVYRLGRRGVETIALGLTPAMWASLVLGTAFFVLTEGVMALERRWVPRLVERAYSLGTAHSVYRVLAPLYGMSLIGATRKRLLIAWGSVIGIVCAVLLVGRMPEPWRGIVDFAVAAALAWGLVAIARNFGRRRS